MKRRLSFLLAMVMVLSTFIVTVSATETITKSENFEAQIIDNAYDRTIGNNAWTITNSAGKNSAIKGDSENKYVEVKIVKGTDSWIYPMSFGVTSFQLTFDMMMPYKGISSYYGFYFHANKFDGNPCDQDAEMLVITQPGTNKNYIKGTETVTDAFDVDKWYTVEFLREGAKIEARIWEKGGTRPEAAVVTNTLSDTYNVAACPAIQLVNRDGGTDETVTTTDRYIYFDNFQATSPYSSNEATYTVEDEVAASEWDQFTVAATNFGNGYETNFSNGFKVGTYGASGSKTVYGVKQEEGNQYYAVNFKQNGGTGTFGITLSAKDFSSDQYSFTGDIRWETANTSGYYGVYFVSKNDANNVVMALSRNKSVDIADGDNQAATKISNAATRGTTWYSFAYTRVGTNVSFTLWEKGTDKPVVASLVKTVPAEAGVPTIRFVGGEAGNTVSVDNLKISTLPVVDCVAAQTTGGLDANNQYAVRFISTVNSLEYAKAGFEITATPTSGNEKQFVVTTQTVYNSIIASDELGITTVYEAIELGGKCLIAVGIKGIPSDLGNVTFKVKPFCENSAGVRTYGAEKTLTVNNGVAVIS